MAGPTTLFQTGVHGSRPAASAGCVLYWCTTHLILYVSSGSAWSNLQDLSTITSGSLTDHTHAATGSGASGGGATLAPTTFDFPAATGPSQTAEGRAVWDSDDDKLTVGTGAARKTMVNEGAATASGLTQATARLLGRTTASTGAIEEISVSGPLSLAAGALGSVITQANADSSADVTLTADTPTDATGVTVSLAAGTWVIMAQETFEATTSTVDYMLMAITDSSNVVVGESRGGTNNLSPLTLPCFAVVSPGSTTSYKVRGQSGRTNNKIKRYSSGTQVGTKIIAIRIA